MPEPVINLTGIGEILSLASGTIRMLVTSEDSNNQYSLTEHMLIPGFPGPPAHYHKVISHNFYVLAGEVAFTIGAESVTAKAGSSIYIPAMLPHTFANQGIHMARMLELDTPGGLDQYFRELATHFPPGVTVNRSLIPIIQQKYDTYPASK